MIKLVSKLTKKEYELSDGLSIGGLNCQINITDDPRTLAKFLIIGQGLFIKMIDSTQIFINDTLPLYPHTKFFLYNNDVIKVEGFEFLVKRDEVIQDHEDVVKKEIEFELDPEIAATMANKKIKETDESPEKVAQKKIRALTRDI